MLLFSLDNSHNTTFIILEDVTVPIENLIGKEGQGFPYIMINFNHERFVISAGALGMCRKTYELSIQKNNNNNKQTIKQHLLHWKKNE